MNFNAIIQNPPECSFSRKKAYKYTSYKGFPNYIQLFSVPMFSNFFHTAQSFKKYSHFQ